MVVIDNPSAALAINAEAVGDLTGDGVDDQALLLTRTLPAQLAIRDGADMSVIRKQSIGPAFTPLSLTVVRDRNGDGIDELALMGVDNKEKKVAIRIEDGASGKLLQYMLLQLEPPKEAKGPLSIQMQGRSESGVGFSYRVPLQEEQ